MNMHLFLAVFVIQFSIFFRHFVLDLVRYKWYFCTPQPQVDTKRQSLEVEEQEEEDEYYANCRLFKPSSLFFISSSTARSSYSDTHASATGSVFTGSLF